MWPGSAKSQGVRERRRGRAHRAYACAHAAGRAGLRGEGLAAAAQAASLFPRAGRCVAARVATGEVDRDRCSEPLRLLPSRVREPQNPARVADPGDARSPCGPCPPAALQVGAAGFPVPTARRGPGLTRCYRGDDLAPGVPVLPRDDSPVLASVPVGWGRAGQTRVGRSPPQVRPRPGPGDWGPAVRALTLCPPDRLCRGPAGTGEVGPASSGQVKDHLDLCSCWGLGLREGTLKSALVICGQC